MKMFYYRLILSEEVWALGQDLILNSTEWEFSEYTAKSNGCEIWIANGWDRVNIGKIKPTKREKRFIYSCVMKGIINKAIAEHGVEKSLSEHLLNKASK